MLIGVATMEYSMELPLKTKNNASLRSSNLNPGYTSGKNSNLILYIQPNIHSSTIYKTQDMEAVQCQICPMTDEWIKNMLYMHTMEYYSIRKNNEIMPFAATWMDVDIIIVSEVRQRQISYDTTFAGNLKKKKMQQINLFTKQK